MYKVNVKRAEFIGSLINRVRDFIDLLEKNDPQYLAVSELVKHYGKELASIILVANALISYQLSSRGEEYWSALSKWFIDRREKIKDINDIMENHVMFLKYTNYNKMGLRHKIKRLQLFYNSSLAKNLVNSPLKYCNQLDKLVYEISKILKTDPTAKTVVFAGKMYYYLCLTCEAEIGGEIPIPVDRRNTFLAISSCIVMGCRNNISTCVKELMTPRNRGIVIEAWKIVSEKANIPLYRLDSFTWLLTGMIRQLKEPIKIYRLICNTYNYCREELLGILKELVHCIAKH
ncbi:N-glycosylase/DNA lyase [Staphylothermus hellenicus]|uniref:N-glycosylase/DNA lyase n=1 Tax=Staphylothermus hellenicus (strain DSM 12710 / JCM 10830 / BK20S6-10-b1 / P8) TaxID=591019 RepID=D7DAL2_STAHD|nr:N-glycosylase/DNA lyase [Staphylothermus hellenicus]ADI31209.1 conserved hypothetical protein [Staphylothermus hellenicus DSM 12710]